MSSEKLLIEYKKIPNHMGYRKHDKNFFINYFNCVVTKAEQVLFSAFNFDEEFVTSSDLSLNNYVPVNYTRKGNKEIFRTGDGKQFQKLVEDKIRKLHSETQPLRRKQWIEEEKIEKEWKIISKPLYEEKQKYLEGQGFKDGDPIYYATGHAGARQYLKDKYFTEEELKKEEKFLPIFNSEIFLKLDATYDKYMIRDINANWNMYVKELCKYDGYVRDKNTCLRCLRTAEVPEDDDSFLCVCGLESFVGKNIFKEVTR